MKTTENAARCGGTFRNGQEKRYARCDRCRRISYDHYEGDKCPLPRK